MYDGWYIAETAEKEEHDVSSCSEERPASIAANPGDAFSEAYDEAFSVAGKHAVHGGAIGRVLMMHAVAPAFAAWASLLAAEHPVRLGFALLSIIGFVYSFILYVQVPIVS